MNFAGYPIFGVGRFVDAQKSGNACWANLLNCSVRYLWVFSITHSFTWCAVRLISDSSSLWRSHVSRLSLRRQMYLHIRDTSVSHPPSALAEQAVSVRLLCRDSSISLAAHIWISVLRLCRPSDICNSRYRDIYDTMLAILEDGTRCGDVGLILSPTLCTLLTLTPFFGQGVSVDQQTEIVYYSSWGLTYVCLSYIF